MPRRKSKAISIGDLAAEICHMVNPSAKVVSVEQRVRPASSEVMKLICAAAKAERLLGWRAEVSLEEGLRRTVEFIRDNLESYQADMYTI